MNTSRPADTNRTQRREATVQRRAQIIRGALHCFMSQGVERSTVAEICRASDCSVGSLYHHFGSKEGVAGALFIDAITQLNEDLLRRLRLCRSVASGVKTVVTQYSDWVSAHPDLARYLHCSEVQFTAADRDELHRLYADHIKAVFEWFRPHVAGGQMRSLPLETYVPLISGPIRDYTRQWVNGRVRREPALVKNVFAEAAWNAVKVVS